jgi:hypothetical protein
VYILLSNLIIKSSNLEDDTKLKLKSLSNNRYGINSGDSDDDDAKENTPSNVSKPPTPLENEFFSFLTHVIRHFVPQELKKPEDPEELSHPRQYGICR